MDSVRSPVQKATISFPQKIVSAQDCEYEHGRYYLGFKILNISLI